jgi:hypothetical protein
MKNTLALAFALMTTFPSPSVAATSLLKSSKASPANNVVTEALLSALSQVESGNDDMARGRDGERSRYQIMPDVWKRFGRGMRPWNKDEAKIVATKIWQERVEWFMKRHDRKPTTVEMYVLWNAPAQAYAQKISPRVMERAVRFERLTK